jgi:endonuclease/exonuclease/phosphatase family metal-dependent hydrolase
MRKISELVLIGLIALLVTMTSTRDACGDGDVHSTISIVTWNVHLLPGFPTDRVESIATRIRSESPDVVFLQEVWTRTAAHLLHSLLGDTYRPFGASGWVLQKGGLLTLLRKDAGLRPLRCLYAPFSEGGPWWRVWEGDGLAGKGILLLVLQSESGMLVAVNTHLQSKYLNRSYQDIRRQQLQSLEEIRLGRPVPSSMILGGDLNTAPSDPLYVATAGGWIDATQQLWARNSVTYLGPSEQPEWIDYIWVAPSAELDAAVSNLRLLTNREADQPYSDHDGLAVSVALMPVRHAVPSVEATEVVASCQELRFSELAGVLSGLK